jgi:hypothetical protein
MEGALAEMLARRRHVFFGSLFGPEGAAPRVPAEAAGSEEVA